MDLTLQSSQKGFCAKKHTRTYRGFTVLEMAVTLTIAAIALMLAIPTIRSVVATNQAIAAGNAVVTGLNMARSSAITFGNPISICPSSDGANCAADSWHRGWIVFNDANADGVAASSEITRVMSMQGKISQSGFGGSIVFASDGTTTLDNDVTISSCYIEKFEPKHCLDIEVSTFGKITSSDLVVTETSGEEETVS